MSEEYRQRTKAQFDVLELEVKIQRGKLDTVVARVKPVLDCIDMEVAPQPDDRPPRSDAIIDRCKVAWENFKGFHRDIAVSVVTPALAVVWSHYPAINLQAIGAGFTRGMGATKQEQLKDEVEDAAKRLASDVDLFSEVDGEGQA